MYIQHIINAYKVKGYRFFDQGEYNLNIYGVRNTQTITDLYDDNYGVIFHDGAVWCNYEWPWTTKPGLWFLNHPMNPSGIAQMCTGQYPGAYKMGDYGPSWQHKALLQNANLRVDYLDRKGQVVLPNVLVPPSSGIHAHCVQDHSTRVGMGSAGCQDAWEDRDFAALWAICQAASLIWGSTFTYTLFNREDIKG